MLENKDGLGNIVLNGYYFYLIYGFLFYRAAYVSPFLSHSRIVSRCFKFFIAAQREMRELAPQLLHVTLSLSLSL